MTLSLEHRKRHEMARAKIWAVSTGALLILVALVAYIANGPPIDDNNCLTDLKNSRERVSTVLLDFTDQRGENYSEYIEKILWQVWAAATPHERLKVLSLTEDEANPLKNIVEICKPASVDFLNMIQTGKGKLERLQAEANDKIKSTLENLTSNSKPNVVSKKSPIFSAIKMLSKEANLSWLKGSKLVIVSDYMENSSYHNFYSRIPSYANFASSQPGKSVVDSITLPGVEITSCELEAGSAFSGEKLEGLRLFWNSFFNDLAQRGSCFSSQCRDFGTPCKWPSDR